MYWVTFLEISLALGLPSLLFFSKKFENFYSYLGRQTTQVEKAFTVFQLLNLEEEQLVQLDLTLFANACEKMASDKTAIIVLERSNNLDFVKSTGDETNIDLSPQILESIFYKNSPLHDGAVIIKGNTITATRVVLPVSESSSIPTRFGLRHRAALGIAEKTDALVVVISEQRGEMIYIKDGEFKKYATAEKLKRALSEDLRL